MGDIQSRKADHLKLATEGDVGFRDKTNLFECVELTHEPLPELSLEEIDLQTRVFGKRLRAPLMVAGMTGGTPRAGQINRTLATLAQRRGIGFGLGSQRPMLTRPETADSYRVRDVAPDVLLFGNIGVVQATELKTEQVLRLAREVDADALCVHLNPAMEAVQPEGDRDFRGPEETLRRLQSELGVPVIAKETGCGIGLGTARRLRSLGIEHVDVSGAGGTSWVAVETQRATAGQRSLGELFWDWGTPTAASVLATSSSGFQTTIATGGMYNGLQVAKAIALGAQVVGIARPVLQALESGGERAAEDYLEQVENELRTAMLLVGAGNLKALKGVPYWLRGDLRNWASAWGLEASRLPKLV